MKARPNTSWDRKIKVRPTLFSDFYTYIVDGDHITTSTVVQDKVG